MIIIPDIHGRTYWKDAVKDRETEDIIFLGDYLDPYWWENISEENVISNFKDIIEFKKSHMNNVTLLLGNHDFAPYISSRMTGCRTLHNIDECRKLYYDNRNLFKIADYRQINGVNYTFSHTHILPMWVKDESVKYPGREGIFYSIKKENEELTISQIIDRLNELYLNEDKNLYIGLEYVSFNRGGWSDCGSCIWADVRENNQFTQSFPGWYQIFGHSQQEKDPIITEYWSCLDCRRAFELTKDDELIPITPESDLNSFIC